MAFFNWSIDLDPERLKDLIFGLAALIAGVVSLVMIWHWRKYGLGSKILALAEIIYLAGAALLIGAAFLNI